MAEVARRIGQILVRVGHITEEQLEEGLRTQKQYALMNKRKPLGRILVEAGYLEERHLESALSIQRSMSVVRRSKRKRTVK
jgi:hypothetical protein